MSFHVNDGEGIQALYYNREVKRDDGWAVANMDSGSCAVQINTGTLGSTADTLTIQSGTALIDGTVTSISQQTQSIPEGGSDPRKDVVLLDSTGSVTRAAGYAEPISPSTATLADSERPAPPDLATTDCVVLAVILVDAGATSITSSEIVDLRAPADYEAVSLSTQSASGETLEALDQLGVPVYSDALSAPAETVFFNSTLENLAFKDASGTVHEAVGELSSLTIDVDKDWQANSISNVDEFRAAFQTHQTTIDTDRTIPSGEGSVIAGSLSGTGTISGDGSLAVIDEGIHEKVDNPMAGDLDAAGYAIANAGSIETDELNTTRFVLPSDSAADIQAAVDSLTSGRTHKERVVVIGDFTLSQTISLPDYTVLDLRNARLTRANETDKRIIQNDDLANGNQHIEIVGGWIDGNSANQSANNPGINMEHVDHLRIRHCDVVHSPGWQIRLKNCDAVEVHDIYAESTDFGWDGVHLIDCSEASVSAVRGDTGDDLVAVSAENETVRNVTVSNIEGTTDRNIVRINQTDASINNGNTVVMENIEVSDVSCYDMGDSFVRFGSWGNGSTLRNVTLSVSGDTSANAAISLGSNNGETFENISIDCRVQNAGGHGIRIVASTLTGLSVTGHIRSPGNRCVHSAGHVSLTDATFALVGDGPVNENVRIENGQDIAVHGTYHGAGGSGRCIQFGTADHTVTHSRVSDITVTDAGTAIDEVGGDYNLITDYILRGNSSGVSTSGANTLDTGDGIVN